MSKQTLVAQTDITDLHPQQVAEYLRQHDEFFAERPQLLNDLRIPHPQTGDAVSLIERQVVQLQQQARDLRGQLNEMMGVAHENQQRLEQLQSLQVALLDAGDLADMLLTLETHLRDRFDCDQVHAVLVGNSLPEGELPTLAKALGNASEIPDDFADLKESGQPLCGRLRPQQIQWLFGENADSVNSAAVMSIGKGCERGLIALGSSREDRFNPAQGTLFLSHLGGYVERLLKIHEPS